MRKKGKTQGEKVRQDAGISLEEYEDFLDQYTEEFDKDMVTEGDLDDETVKARALEIRKAVMMVATKRGLSDRVAKRLGRDIAWGYIIRRAYQLDE